MSSDTLVQLGEKRLSAKKVEDTLDMDQDSLKKLARWAGVTARQHYSAASQMELVEAHKRAIAEGKLEEITSADFWDVPDATDHPVIDKVAEVAAEVADATADMAAELRERIQEVTSHKDPAPADVKSDEPSSDLRPLKDVVKMISSRDITVSIDQAMAFLGKDSADALIGPAEGMKLREEFRTKVSEGSEVLAPRQEPSRFSSISKRRQARDKPTKADVETALEIFEFLKTTWKNMGEPLKFVKGGGATVTKYRCLMIPGNLISLSYKEYRELDAADSLPPVSDKSVFLVADKIESMTQYRKVGDYCGQPGVHFAVGDVRAMVARQMLPPLVNIQPRADRRRTELDISPAQAKELGLTNAREFKFHQDHPACIGKGCLVALMRSVEGEFTEGKEDSFKTVSRLSRYLQLLKEPYGDNEKSRLQHIIDSEWFYDRSLGRPRRLSSVELRARLMKINDNLTNLSKEG